MPQRAVLLVNLGSPDAAAVAAVRRYLAEFLGDERVLDAPPQPLRWLLLHGLILRTRPPKSAHAYARIWTPEGSPLIVASRSVQRKLAAALGPDLPVALAMRYGRPSVASVIAQLAAGGVEEALLIPQYPHYAMSSWETVVVKVREEAGRLAPRLRLATVQPFYADADYIEALFASVCPYLARPYDHLLFSYHGLPVRHLRQADSSGAHCLVVPDCCNTCSPAHATCYKAQVTRTTQALARRASLDPARYSLSFQSRLVGEPWLQPYTDVEFLRLAAEGRKRLLVITPTFVADCLETLEEIRLTGRDAFLQAGGETFQHIPCLNDHPAYIAFLVGRVRRWLGQDAPVAAPIGMEPKA
ncbi:MAG TPA: ferrochelatase [Opitutaceae bacterium]|nr:ferrochelatase [Opitutaceae bacterium]